MNTTSKTDLKELALQSIEAVKNGEADALPEYIEARKQEEYYKQLSKELQPFAISEREQYPEKRLNTLGAFTELSYTGDRLNYSEDTIYNELEKALKERQKELKMAHDTPHTIVDCNGEVIPKVGIKTHGKQIIKVSY